MSNKNFRSKMPVEKLTEHKREVSLFCTIRGKTSDLKKLHPELATTKEFKGISPPQLRFAWYYAIYFAKAQTENIRIIKSLQFGFYDSLDSAEHSKYLNGNFPNKVVEAISKFDTYNLDIRLRARLISEVTLYNWERLSDVDVDKDFIEDEKTNWTAKKQYVDMTNTITSNMPELIRQVENGFGVRETKFEKETSEKFIENFHEKEQ